MKNKVFILLIVTSIIIKFLLYSYVVIKTPNSIMQVDSIRYLKCSDGLINEGVFGTINPNGRIFYELFRTPGYPIFLSILRTVFGNSLAVIIFIQVILNLFSAVFIFKAAKIISPKIAKLSALIVLFDPPSMVYSMMILTETLFMFILSLFLFFFVKYLNCRKMKFLLLSAVTLVCAIYVRPVAYYLGLLIVMVILLFNSGMKIRKKFLHALIFIILVFLFVGVWHYRNINRFGKNKFSNISTVTLGMKGLIGSYHRNEDMYTKDVGPVKYYISVTTRCFMSLLTRPVSFKYFGSNTLKYAGKIFSYPWIIFWIVGFIYGIIKGADNKYILFMFFVVLYFIIITIVSIMWGSDARFRVPMLPFIAIISAFGWTKILSYKNKQ